MKTCEFMIGDLYYQCVRENKYIAIIQPDDFMTINLINAEPIPITVDMLKRNGFRESWSSLNIGGVSMLHRICGYVLFRGDEKTNFILCPSLDNDRFYYSSIERTLHTDLEIRFVHELQHLLKLCKIEKEIVI